MSTPGFSLGGITVRPGTQATVELPLPALYTHAQVSMPVRVIHGRKPGPRLFVSAALHGDEINGVEVIRRVLSQGVLRHLRGVLIAVPVVNIYGFLSNSRYLPDRRDLNRAFPGSERGSLTARLAHLFLNEVVRHATHGIDLHTGAIHRANLPQIRTRLSDPKLMAMARAFGTPVIMDSTPPDGSLRQAASNLGLPLLLYEAGEALRFDELAIRAGVRGVLGVMRSLDMLPVRREREPRLSPLVAASSAWVRAPQSGILRAARPLGTLVGRGEIIAVISDPFGERETPVPAPRAGLVVGRTNLPLVTEGDALFNLAHTDGGGSDETVAGFEDLLADARELGDPFNPAQLPQEP